jgi:uncharacterized protein YdcH (DUF465 family)
MDALDARDAKHGLLESDQDYRQLAEQHHQLDEQLRQLTARHYLSTSDHAEEAALKKRKLALKDRMETIARQRAHGNPGH